MREVKAPKCGRENDLVGFLYGELDQVEALAFRRHLNECATCATELSGFGAVRESVVAWRNESLAGIGLPAQVADSIPARTAQARPSAIAALREFFNLSPLWLKGATAFAAILFCLFAGLAVARLRDKPQPVIATIPAAPARIQSTDEFNALVERRVKEEVNRIKNSSDSSATPTTAQNSAPANKEERIVHRNNAATASSHGPRRPLSKTEREQLAADLRLVSAKGEGDLSLLDDTLNQ
ncbi:MAG TPA: zf-HC2 domain-containing protein [Pyrinomonadaceae bacterium]|jgi:hypothetical protein|nr:zf-HC2 domain-containing protein [Pyrinomonadaceae bacterium]